jgi:flagellar hook-associated protein 1 FlgK
MGIDAALYNAMSSLDMQQQQASLIANNISNASTPGYVRRTLPQLELIAGANTGGVMAGTIQRLGDETAAASANQAGGSQAYSQRMVDVLTQVTQTIGQASDSTSLPSQISAFSQALTSLASTPDSAAVQDAAVTAAQNLTSTFHTMDAAVSAARQHADQAIGTDVTTVNQSLDQLAQNESALQRAAGSGQSTAAFQDQRDNLLASISQNLPIKVYQSANNGIIVTTDQGTTLWDGMEHKLSFTPTANIPAELHQTADPANGYAGGLSAVTVDGRPLTTSQSGSIAANLRLRDVTLPAFSRQLDQMAGNLIKAYQQVDPTVSAGQTGLFTVNGAALNAGDATAIPGLAREIAVNTAVDPSSGGQAWRMRDGVQATTQGQPGDNSTVLALGQAMTQAQSYDSSTGLSPSMTLMDAAAESAGSQQAALSTWTANNTTRTQQSQDAQTALSNKTGVNVDDELQRLLIVQQTYAASAQVLQAASKMLDILTQMH